MVSSPALTTGLAVPLVQDALGIPMPPHSAMVCVGPPLSANPAGSSMGFVLLREVPMKPHVVPSSMLCPPSVMASPAQLPPEVLLAMMVLVIVTVPPT